MQAQGPAPRVLPADDRRGQIKPDDIVQATIVPGRRCRFRVLARRGLVELYHDELLIQCYSLPREPTGRIGLVVESSSAVFEGLEAWQMNL